MFKRRRKRDRLLFRCNVERSCVRSAFQGRKTCSNGSKPFNGFDRSRSPTAGFLAGLQFRARSRNHHDRPDLPLIPSIKLRTDSETCMRDVELYPECSIRVQWLKSISRWTKEALRWEAKRSSLAITTCLPDSMWTRKVS